MCTDTNIYHLSFIPSLLQVILEVKVICKSSIAKILAKKDVLSPVFNLNVTFRLPAITLMCSDTDMYPLFPASLFSFFVICLEAKVICISLLDH